MQREWAHCWLHCTHLPQHNLITGCLGIILTLIHSVSKTLSFSHTHSPSYFGLPFPLYRTASLPKLSVYFLGLHFPRTFFFLLSVVRKHVRLPDSLCSLTSPPILPGHCDVTNRYRELGLTISFLLLLR